MSEKETSGPSLFGWPWTTSWPLPGNGAPIFGFGPAQLTQPINPGWTFGNVIVNNANSSAPQVEQDVVSQHSYGRQIGRLMGAVEALVEALPQTRADARVQDLERLAEQVRQIKLAGSAARLERLRCELAALKARDRAAWQQLVGRDD